MTPLQTIASYGLPTDSYIAAIQLANNEDLPLSLTKDQYEQGVADIVGLTSAPSVDTDKEARVLFLYTVQETIRAFNDAAGAIPDMEGVWTDIQKRAKVFQKNHPWVFKDYAAEKYENETGEVKLDSVGKPKQRKGAKKAQAEALYQKINGTTDRAGIIAALMKDVGMTKAGATTYFHNCKKQFGFKEPK